MTTPNPTIPTESTQPLQSTMPEETSSTSGTTPATSSSAAETSAAKRNVSELRAAIREHLKANGHGKGDDAVDKQTLTSTYTIASLEKYEGTEEEIKMPFQMVLKIMNSIYLLIIYRRFLLNREQVLN